MLKVVVPVTALPHPHHTVRAVNVVSFELLRCLARQEGMAVRLLPVRFGDADSNAPTQEDQAVTALSAAGIECLPGLELPPLSVAADRKLMLRQLAGLRAALIPATQFSSQARACMARTPADVLLTIWSEVLTATFADCPVPKVAYYGNPDPVNRRAGILLSDEHDRADVARQFVRNVISHQFERRHVQLIRQWDTLLNVAANGAEFYRERGHPSAKYVRNTWIDRLGRDTVMHRPEWRPGDVARIICNVGRPAGTANTFGLRWLAQELLPAMRQVFGAHRFELHVLGAGAADPRIAPALEQPEIVMRGFVDDIDGELLANPLFLCTNNATAYNVGHTRYLHAWTLGCCVIAHANVRDAMPELVHDKNSLLGTDAHDLAVQLKRAADTPMLVRHLGDAGYKTFAELFAPERVAVELADELRAAAYGRGGAKPAASA